MVLPRRLAELTIRGSLNQEISQSASLSDYWNRNALQYPTNIAVTDGSRRITWSEAKMWTDQIGLSLIKLGIRRDELLVVQIPNRVEQPLIRVACEKAGILSLPIPCTLRQYEMGKCLQQTEAVAVLVTGIHRGFDHSSMVLNLRQNLPHLRYILISENDNPIGTISLEKLLCDSYTNIDLLDSLEKRHYKSTEVSILNATTGSTGLPKFAKYTAAARLLCGKSYIDVFELTEKDIFAALSPAAGGPNIPIYFAAPQIAAKSVFMKHFEPRKAFELIQQEKITIACLVPTQLALMTRFVNYSSYDISSIRIWLSVGAPLSPSLAAEAEDKLGGKVLNSYGAVDWGGAVFPSPQDHSNIRHFTVGTPRAGTEIRLEDEWQRQINSGMLGEVVGRGPSCSSGYYMDLDSANKGWNSEGWLRLGDLAHWDTNGNLIVLGRKDDLIIRGGQNIIPIDIENHLLCHPNIKQAAIIGIPDPVMGQKVCAYIVSIGAPYPNLEEISQFLESRGLAKYKLPERIEVLDHLPILSETKIDKQALQSDIAKKIKIGL